MNWPSTFSGSKIALFQEQQILVYRRDDKPGIPFPGLWDLPGGGREGNETPEDCVLREVFEEFGIRLPTQRIYWSRLYSPASGPAQCFFAGRLESSDVAAIRFGNEGQEWSLMETATYLRLPDAVISLQQRVAECLAAHGQQAHAYRAGSVKPPSS